MPNSSGYALDSHFVIEILSLESFEFAKKKKIIIIINKGFWQNLLIEKMQGSIGFLHLHINLGIDSLE